MLKFSIFFIHGLIFINTIGIKHDLCSRRNTSNPSFLFLAEDFPDLKLKLCAGPYECGLVLYFFYSFFMTIFSFGCIDPFNIDFVGVGLILLHSFLKFFEQF